MRPIPDRLTPLECWPAEYKTQDKTRQEGGVFVKLSGRRRELLLGVKTWLSTLEIVNLCVFRMIH